MTNDLYGWFDDAGEVPGYDPPYYSPCPHCGIPVSVLDVRTHSFVAQHGAVRSYFYRTHRSCDEAASPTEQQAIFDGVLARLESDGQPV